MFGGLPTPQAHAVKTKQAGLRSDPQIPVGGLRERQHTAVEKALANRPCGVPVLTDVPRWIQRDRGGTPHEQRDDQRCTQRSETPWSIHRSHHRNGMTAVIVVPRPRELSKWNVPFSWLVRSRIMTRPKPTDAPKLRGSKPAPSSETVSDTSSPERVSRTVIRLACACFAALPSAS